MTDEMRKKAAEWVLFFERRDGKIYPVRQRPENLEDAVIRSHGGRFPDDWSYEFIYTSLVSLAEGDTEPPALDHVFPYTASRIDWFASCPRRRAACDEFLSHASSIGEVISMAMEKELQDVFEVMREAVELAVEEDEDESEEDESEEDESEEDESED